MKVRYTKTDPNHVSVQKAVTVKDTEGKDVEIWKTVAVYGQRKIDEELAKTTALKIEQLQAIQTEMDKLDPEEK